MRKELTKAYREGRVKRSQMSGTFEDAKRALIAAKKADARTASLAYLEGKKLANPRRREQEVAKKLLVMALLSGAKRKT
jgi:hypothetical protein